MKNAIKRYFFVGLFTLLPLFITVWVFWSLFGALEAVWAHLLRAVFGRHIPGLGPILSLTLVLAAGVFATNVLGQRFIGLLEGGVARIPLVNRIYSMVKEILNSLSVSSKSKAFTTPVLVEFPKEGMYSVAFVTGDDPVGFGGLPEGTLRVFVPTTPNVTTGFLILLPKEKCIFTDLSVEEAFRLILSVGVLLPKGRAERGPEPLA